MAELTFKEQKRRINQFENASESVFYFILDGVLVVDIKMETACFQIAGSHCKLKLIKLTISLQIYRQFCKLTDFFILTGKKSFQCYKEQHIYLD